jgi:hypothetical protein
MWLRVIESNGLQSFERYVYCTGSARPNKYVQPERGCVTIDVCIPVGAIVIECALSYCLGCLDLQQ